MFTRSSNCTFAGVLDRLVPSETQFCPQNLEPRIEVREFGAFVVRYLADITEKCMSMHADPAVVAKFRDAVAALPAADTDVRPPPR